MYIEKNNLDKLSVLKVFDLNMDSLVAAMKTTCDDTVYIIDQNMCFQGLITVGDCNKMLYKKNNFVEYNRNCTYLNDNTGGG